MRVLYLSHFPGLGGAERSLLELMVAVRKLGVESMLLCPSGPLGEQAAMAGIPVATWHARAITRWRGQNGLHRAFPQLVRGWLELAETVGRFRPDILHANNIQSMVWNGPVAWWRACPVVWHWRDYCDFHAPVRFMARGTAAVVAISEAMFASASAVLGTSASRLVLVRNGVADLPPLDTNQAAALRLAMGIPPGAQLVVMAGQSVPRKGHAILLQALAQLAASQPNLRAWLLCSEFDWEASAHTRRLRQQAEELGCARSVQITDGVDQIAPVLRAADVVVVPSLREPFGRIAVEAMLAERPLVASAVDGLNEIVTEGETGLLVPPGDPARLAAGLVRVLREPTLWASRGKAARSKALRLFSVSRVADEMVSLYRTVRRS